MTVVFCDGLTKQTCVGRPRRPVWLLACLRDEPTADLSLDTCDRVASQGVIIYEQWRAQIGRILTIFVVIRNISWGRTVLGDQMSDPIGFVLLVPCRSWVFDTKGPCSVGFAILF